MVNLHYFNRYNKIIDHYKKINLEEGYVEKHHIIPKCKGGSNNPDNIIILPARVHFICHYILYKAYPKDIQLAHAFAMMAVNNSHQLRDSKLYEIAKMARSIALKGVPRPLWVIDKLKTPKRNKENYKKPKSEIHKQNISDALKGKKHDWHHKILESEGFIKRCQDIKQQALDRKNFHRDNFKKLNLSRKEYFKLFPEISPFTLKKYLNRL